LAFRLHGLLFGHLARTHYLSDRTRTEIEGRLMFESLQERTKGVEGHRPDRDCYESKALSRGGLTNV